MKKSLILIFMILLSASLFGQAKVYEGPSDPAGDPSAEREGRMTGNRVSMFFRNTSEISDYNNTPNPSRWPDNYDGVDMTDGIGLLIGARVYVMKGDSIPVRYRIPGITDDQIAGYGLQGMLDTLFYCQTSYREEQDMDPTGTVEWSLYPAYGYFNEFSENPAMSNNTGSWPTIGWPAATGFKWPGEWNGRFGRGVIYADLESFFVTNDAQDQEYILRPAGTSKYIPRPGVYIGDHPTFGGKVTKQRGKPWGGLGVRVEQRGFQWNNPQARDAIFWEYNIANISEYTIQDVAFGYWVDNAIGGNDPDDDLGYFDELQDLSYSWDIDGIGAGGVPTGLMGFAYLESPGEPNDGEDNDQDGLIDEQRDNDAGTLIGATQGISDMNAFLSFYSLNAEDLHEHWSGDEDQDWMDGDDANGNGIYEATENPGDDVGTDGVGPGDLNYTGPDADGTECNHKPDYVEGVGCEPNFNATDVSESDMIGLTTFRLFRVPSHTPPYTNWFRNDQSMWLLIGGDTLQTHFADRSNLIETFASGPFPLPAGRTERISMSNLFAYDPLEGLTEENGYRAPSLFEKKRIVQVIYEKDYRFAQPPHMPTLTATPLDGKVILTWDDMADTKTRDPFLGNINDFEGYKLYRATDKKMQDAEVITDGYGDKVFKKAIFQCDVKNDKIGFTDFGLVNGMGYYLGSDTGIRHYFIDENVQNGRTYYYALVAYDFGAEDIGPGIAPSENNVIIELDEAEEITGTSKNVAIVKPYQQASGYVADNIEMIDNGEVYGSGSVEPEILATKALNADRVYEVTFDIDTLSNVEDYEYGLKYTNSGVTVKDAATQAIIYQENATHYTGTNIVISDSLGANYINPLSTIKTDVFDGMRLNVTVPVVTAQLNYRNTGWVVGNAMMKLAVAPEAVSFPWEYDVVFGDTTEALYTGRGIARRIRDENNTQISRNLLNAENLPFKVMNKSVVDADGNYELLDLVVLDVNTNGKFDILRDRVICGIIDTTDSWAGTVMVIDFSYANGNADYLPSSGDQYHVSFTRPYWKTDKILFKVNSTDSLDTEGLAEGMKNIRVVPNPYIATNSMETSVLNSFLNQRRQLMFTHLPAQCTIKIFTVSGVFVDEIVVNNSSDNGTAHWDLKTREDLEIAAGMYLYHVKSKETGKEKMGKFAVIK